MALTLASIGKPKTLAVDLGGDEPLNITYRTDFVTEEFDAAARSLNEGNNPAHNLANMVYNVMQSWDFTDIEFSRESLAKVPSAILSKILVAIVGDSGPNPATVEA